MADETNQEVSNTEVNDSVAAPAPQERQYTDTEQRAMALGWVPEDQYQGTGKWRSAEEFIDRGELFSKIDELKRQNRTLEGTMHEFKKYHKKMVQAEYNRALNHLKAQKRAALDEGDHDKVIQIDDAIANTKTQAAAELQQMDAQPQMAPAADPVFMVWQNRNPWYDSNRAMKIYADTVGEELVVKHGMNNPTEILNEIERRVKKEFPQHFTNPNRKAPGAVEGPGNTGSKTKETFQLSDEETRVMNKFVKAGLMTKDEYIAELKASRRS